MILQQLLEETRSSLASHGVEEAVLEADLLLMKAVGLDRSRLYSSPDRLVALEESETLSEDLARRLEGEPWPYICGYREFYGLDMAVGPGVFIPRPETELVVDLALDLARSMPSGRPIRIADVGTGSGAVAVSLAVHLPQATVYATDVSAPALETARLNCQRHGVESRVTVLEGNLLEPVPEALDIVVSNPPYIPRAEMARLPREVGFEPREALDGGEDGLDVVRALVPQALTRLRKGGGLMVELFHTQGNQARALAGGVLPWGSFNVVRDLAGKERALMARV